jgi:hypothetical protein
MSVKVIRNDIIWLDFEPTMKNSFLQKASKVVGKSLQFWGGTLYGLKKTYDLGSAVDGELTEHGKQKLKYSVFSFTAEEAAPSTDVIFSLLNAKRASLKQLGWIF